MEANVVNVDNNQQRDKLPENVVFSLDIGTRSIIGMVGAVENEKIKVIAIEKAEHSKRAMIDGQIEDIDQVAKVAKSVKDRLEEKLGCQLTRVCVAAAGRALKTERATYELELPRAQRIDPETISRLEAGAISVAESAFIGDEDSETRRQFFLVGYSVSQYYLDNYLISNLKDHHGKKIRADVIATFLPSEVVESLYTTMHKIGLEVSSLTLEPIAAINAAIPQNLRLLNMVLVDIGAGTSDIAVCRDGSVVGYTMATIAGDEITETLMKQYLIDFETAERIKFDMAQTDEIQFTDVLGFDQTVTTEEIFGCIEEPSQNLCREISERILEVNGGPPSAVFLAGGGSKLAGMRDSVAKYLKMDIKRVAIAGNNFHINAFSSDYDINNPEYATPLGIAISAGLNLINDSFQVILNGNRAKLFRSGSLTVLDILMMNGFGYQDLLGHSGQNLVLHINDKRVVYYGEHSVPAVLLVNGQNAKVSDIIHAGDNIEFEPARHGAAAQKKLRDILDYSGQSVTVNGDVISEDAPLKTGDIIFIESNQSFDELEEDEIDVFEEKEAGFILEPEQPSATSMQAEAPVEEPAVFQTSPILVNRSDSISSSTILSDERQMHFTLNGKSIALPMKEENSPYYLMDMLQYSDLDFDNLSGEVVLKVNGEDGLFRQKLYDNDVIQIYDKKD